MGIKDWFNLGVVRSSPVDHLFDKDLRRQSNFSVEPEPESEAPGDDGDAADESAPTDHLFDSDDDSSGAGG